jgi:hypothetical protein
MWYDAWQVVVAPFEVLPVTCISTPLFCSHVPMMPEKKTPVETTNNNNNINHQPHRAHMVSAHVVPEGLLER